jgi:hypothetical protein
MTVIKFPGKLPAPTQLELPRAQLCGLLQDMATQAMMRANELMRAENAAQFAAVVRGCEQDTASAKDGWTALSKQIRESWGI